MVAPVNEVAEGVFQIPLMAREGVNAYLAGDLLVDSGYGFQAKKVLEAVRGRTVTAHAITHAHWDHVGGSSEVCRELGVPLWAGARDAEAARTGRMVVKEGRIVAAVGRAMKFKPAQVDRELHEGEEIAGFKVLETPGHSPGHIALWRESDRTLIAGDVFFNLSLVTLRYGLRPPPNPFTPDPAENRRSMRRVAELEPAVACFGHGPVVTDAAPKLRACVERMRD